MVLQMQASKAPARFAVSRAPARPKETQDTSMPTAENCSSKGPLRAVYILIAYPAANSTLAMRKRLPSAPV